MRISGATARTRSTERSNELDAPSHLDKARLVANVYVASRPSLFSRSQWDEQASPALRVAFDRPTADISEGLLLLLDLTCAIGVAEHIYSLEGPSVLEAVHNQRGRAPSVCVCEEMPKLVVGRRCAPTGTSCIADRREPVMFRQCAQSPSSVPRSATGHEAGCHGASADAGGSRGRYWS